MYHILFTNQLKKDLGRQKKRSVRDLEEIRNFITLLKKNRTEGVPLHHIPHKFKGAYKEHWEARINPGLLIIWFEASKDHVITPRQNWLPLRSFQMNFVTLL